ncbi:hypothetical protein ACFO8O_06860 [Hephaestia sp. GCM10023244]|uniref:hypothetical protein n=1 Tax=unclassified Hephaestia TaxID=2631281 RepID=UPI00207716B9|nr:hypothetical protein [Hephaestia sp. MAHUQ-44]MCM8730688.1 hypothetical protein [Hephaestia sp. MAHUQ-44]
MRPLPGKTIASRGDAVQRPRAGDGVGQALRNAFGDEMGALPPDMKALLQSLDCRSGQHHLA